jgi:hypothetical protein
MGFKGMIMNNQELLTYLLDSRKKASDLISAQEWKKAFDLMNRALEELGNKYRTPNLRDDTGNRIALAQALPKLGMHENAAKLLFAGFNGRVKLFNEKMQMGE